MTNILALFKMSLLFKTNALNTWWNGGSTWGLEYKANLVKNEQKIFICKIIILISLVLTIYNNKNNVKIAVNIKCSTNSLLIVWRCWWFYYHVSWSCTAITNLFQDILKTDQISKLYQSNLFYFKLCNKTVTPVSGRRIPNGSKVGLGVTI